MRDFLRGGARNTRTKNTKKHKNHTVKIIVIK